MVVNDKTEIGTLECHLSSNRYGYGLNRAIGLGSVFITSNLLLSGREEVGTIKKLQALLLRITRRRYALC